MTDSPKNCEHCRYFKEHKQGVLGADGICRVIPSKPRPVRRWFTNCKQFTRKED